MIAAIAFYGGISTQLLADILNFFIVGAYSRSLDIAL
jgi:hypothetical protein